MSLRYATIENLQADGSGEDGAGGQRAEYKRSAESAGNKSLGVGDQKRLLKLFKPAYLDDDGALIYNPKVKMLETLDHLIENDDGDLLPAILQVVPGNNPDFPGGVNLNFNSSPKFKTTDKIVNNQDNPRHGVPNIRVSKEDLDNPENTRTPTFVERRNRGFGTEYEINDISEGATKRASIGMYLSKANSIHDGGLTARLGKSDPEGKSYTPLVVESSSADDSADE